MKNDKELLILLKNGGPWFVGNRDSAIGIATGWIATVRFPTGGKDFSFLHSVQTGSGANPASYPVGTGCSLPGGNATGS
jgi:hypothetical protein